MGSELKQIVKTVREYVGVMRKKAIREVFENLVSTKYGRQLPNYGDDTAVIPWEDEFLLFSADGMMQGLLQNEPYAAGKAAVMVTVNDIYSMGGRPLGMVNVMASGDDQQRAEIVRGIRKGCSKLRVPMLGGHLHPDAPIDHPALSIAILGHAKKLLRSHLASPGENIVLAVDMNGQPGCRSVVSWDANSNKTPEELIYRLETMPLIAENGLSKAAKDISNAGVIGTTAIMMENSGCGANLRLENIPKPENVDLSTWLLCFQSFGFVLSVSDKNTRNVLDLFLSRGIQAAIIGIVTSESKITLDYNGDRDVLFDFTHDEITGIRYNRDT